MRGAEFLIFFGFLMAPPLLLGLLVLALLRERFAGGSNLLKLGAAATVLSGAVAFGAVVLGPAWLGRYIGVKGLHLFGERFEWAPFAFLAVAIAVVLVLAFSPNNNGARRRSREL